MTGEMGTKLVKIKHSVHMKGVQVVGGSNPPAPTTRLCVKATSLCQPLPCPEVCR